MASGLQGRLMSIPYWLRLTLWIFLSPPPPSPLSPHHHTSPENESFGSDSVRCEIWEIPKNEVLRYFCSVSLSLWSFPLRLFCLDCSKNECSQHTDQPCSHLSHPLTYCKHLKLEVCEPGTKATYCFLFQCEEDCPVQSFPTPAHYLLNMEPFDWTRNTNSQEWLTSLFFSSRLASPLWWPHG